MPDWEMASWPRAEHLQRVFHVRSGTSSGTAFALDVDGKQYLVSALHVIERAAETAVLDIHFQSNWKSFRVDVIGVNFEADVAVLALQERIVASALPIEINGSGCAAGQEVFILGFPLGIVGYAVQPGYPIPLVKRGVAAMFNPGPPRSIYISASANPGFSGGPVYFANHQGKATLMAIVTAELGYEVPVKNEQGETVGKIMKDSNIVACSYIDHALTLIGDNPRGLPIA